MRMLDEGSYGESQIRPPTVDEVPFRSLYQKTQYAVDTADGWSLMISRYRPVPQAFHQPLWGEPMLLVHGFSQNRHCWTSGEFVKNLLFFGADIHILELRGHGKSSIAFQKERAARYGRKLPDDLDYDWDIDSHFLYDLPAAVAGVKRITGRRRIYYCGHSMGGILGYGYAGIHDDFEGLITIGAPADIGRDVPLLRLIAGLAPAIGGGLDLAFEAMNLERKTRKAAQKLLARGKAWVSREALPDVQEGEEADIRFRYVPVDAWLKWGERQLAKAESHALYGKIATRVNRLSNSDRVSAEELRWLLREGGEREPRKVLEQFARWIRKGEMRCYRTGYDFKRGFSKIRVPMAIIFGDLDPLASVESTRSVYRAAQSEYLLWRPVKGNSHVELTMGHDIRQICYDIKNLIEYARTHMVTSPALPRLR